MMEITKFFDKKKQDLKSKSIDEDDSERPQVLSLENSIMNSINTDVFNEFLKSEDCVIILYSCMKILKEEMKKVIQMCKRIKDSPINGETQLKYVSESIDFMNNKFDEYERERQEKDKIIDSMKNDMVQHERKD